MSVHRRYQAGLQNKALVGNSLKDRGNMMKHLVLVALLGLTGCAGTAEYLRSEPVTHFQVTEKMPVPEQLEKLITLHCMKSPDTGQDSPSHGKECLYLSADISKLASAAPDNQLRDQALAYLMGLSDMNCSNFLHRAFANKAGLDFTKSFISDLATGVSAGTVYANPAISAGLSVGNLVVGKGVETFNAVYYYDKTFQAMESAIAAERLRVKGYIIARQAKSNGTELPVLHYEILAALSDIRVYDDACSIKAGLAKLVQVADDQKAEEVKNNQNVEFSANPVEKWMQLNGLQLNKTPENK